MTGTLPDLTTEPSHFAADSRHWHPFTPYSDEVHLKVFTADVARNETAVMLRAEAGAQLGVHDHFGRVLAYTLRGRWSYAEHDWVSGPGDFVYEVANSQHTLVADPAEDIEMFIYVEGPIHFLGADGEIVGIETARTFADRYLRFCLDNGYPAPELNPY
ncbi:hypothetical protein GCM10017691_61280 [Pseudonocardia petroleophila]|uniref:2,4'-dihydroxyacetophenone dioxygenase family protein n=1 Tax=Pseudonocardia petroleophila TaxID=37331 RepID=A0A7G7MM81_9PSEU|nr:2,4'-dihydroxyacetophenone dioxygenase family protein [Pseudonocardia petroleophila]QNG53892.1 2,4'-dihydroxyacetophenone dioxygenase family protein [Pseudonocardia petroleophila]